MRLEPTSDLWWKNAILYCLDVEAYLDGDGTGSAISRASSARSTTSPASGVTCLWLMPFYPSPNRDDGYDITDFYGVDSRLGSHGDFVEFVRTASDRGIKVIVDLVMNHTSDEHPWFEAARADPESPFRSFYVWRDEPSDEPAGISFPDRETSNWERDAKAGSTTCTRFYRFQPTSTLPTRGGPDREDRGLAAAGGGRVSDGRGPLPTRDRGHHRPGRRRPPRMARDLRSFVVRRSGRRCCWRGERGAEGAVCFFGDEDGDQLHMQFAFLLNQHLWLSLAREAAEPLEGLIRSSPAPPPDNAWATFLRNHDELSLDKLTAPSARRFFGLRAGRVDAALRPRAAPPCRRDARWRRPRLRMAWSLMLSLPAPR